MRMADPLRPVLSLVHSDDSTPPTARRSLERRVRRLEDAVAAIQDTQIMEDRVVERVVQRVDTFLLSAKVRADRQCRSDAATQDCRLRFRKCPTRRAKMQRPPRRTTARPGWCSGVLNELRWMLRMLTDYRYRMSWTGRIVLVAAIVVGFLSWFVIAGIPIIGGILDRIVLILAARRHL